MSVMAYRITGQSSVIKTKIILSRKSYKITKNLTKNKTLIDGKCDFSKE